MDTLKRSNKIVILMPVLLFVGVAMALAIKAAINLYAGIDVVGGIITLGCFACAVYVAYLVASYPEQKT
jgi:hypothetical protein